MQKIKKITFVILATFAVFCFFGVNFASANFIWTERRPAGDVNRFWSAAASDADGSNLIVSSSNSFVPNRGRLYTSSDFGVTWTERRPAGNVERQWYGVASDYDGSNLVAGVLFGRLYTSSDYGATWTERRPKGDTSGSWRVASDADGSNIIAEDDGGHIYVSTDYGVSWNLRQPTAAMKNWVGVASDADGSNLIVGDVPAGGGRLYTSSDFGTTWTERRPAGDANRSWITVSSDSDGSNLIAGDYGGRLYTSSNSGANWTERQPASAANYNWNAVASDSDGTNLIAGISTGRLYVSSDSGATWTEHQPAGVGDKSWNAIASNSDGSLLIAGIADSRLYIGALSMNSAPKAVISCTPASCSVFAGDPLILNNDSTDDDGIADIVSQRWYVKQPSGPAWDEKAYCSGDCLSSNPSHGPNNYCSPCTPQSIEPGPWQAKVVVVDSAGDSGDSDDSGGPLDFTIKTDIAANFECAIDDSPNPPVWVACDEDFLAREGDVVLLYDTSVPSEGGSISSWVWEKASTVFSSGAPTPAFEVLKSDIADNAISLQLDVSDTNGRMGSITKVISALPSPTYIPKWIEISPF